MKTPYFLKSSFYFILALGISYQGLAKNNAPTAEQQQLLNNNKGKVSFTENKGQVKDQNWQSRSDVLYSGETQGMVFHIRNNGISYQLVKEEKHETNDFNEIKEKTYSTYRVDINWLNANSNYSTEKGRALPGYNNYYNVPNGVEPALNVKNYENITLKNVWNGVDLHYFEKDGILESDWLMQKAEDYKNIKFEVKGATLSTDKEGYLIMKTPFGEIREGKLKIYQEGKELTANWVIQGNKVSFNIKNYNKDLPLRIDPPTLVWGTYYGGSLEDKSQALVVDNNENIYLSGATKSTTAIATIGSHQTTFGGGVNFDAFLVKFNSNGVRQWSTYYGGNGSEEGKGLAIDPLGNLYLAGYATSSSGISTSGAQQLNIAGGTWDAFIAKFDSNGFRQWGTYSGGPGADWGESVAVDASGNVYLAGATSSTTGIASTTGTHQSSNRGGSYDGFLVKYNTNGAKQWGTYYGGNGTDWVRSVITDNAGDVYFAGYTVSTDYIATLGSYPGGNRCAFYVKFNPNGTRQWGRYYGGSSGSDGYALAIDTSDNLYLVGSTTSTDNSMGTAGTHQPTHGGGTWDAFLAKFNATSTNGARIWGTFYGGTDNDEAYAVTTDVAGNVYIAGTTRSLNNISTTGAYQTTHGGGAYDAFLVHFNSSGIRQSASYYGGTSADYGSVVFTGSTGDIYFGGEASSTTSIASSGAHQTIYGGGITDAFLVKFQGIGCSGVPIQPSAITGNTTLCEGTIETYSVTNDINATSYTWTLPSGWNGTSTTNSITITAGTSSGTITVTANNACGSSTTQTLTVTVNPLPTMVATGTATICAGDATTLTATGASSYAWDNGAGTGASVSVSPTSTTTYTVTGTDANSCSNTAQVTVTVNPLPSVVATGAATICAGDATTLTATGASSYAWDNGAGTGASVSVSPTSTTTYTVTGTDANSCSNTAQVTVTVNPLPSVVYTQTPNIVCENDAPFVLTGGSPSGGVYSGTGVSAGSFDPALASAGTHTITYSFTDGNNCSNADTQQIQVDVCAGIDEQANQLVTVYPNPFKNEFTVSFTTNGNHTIELLNVLGEQVKLINVYEQNTVINTDDLPSGVYFLRIVDEKLIFKLLKN